MFAASVVSHRAMDVPRPVLRIVRMPYDGTILRPRSFTTLHAQLQAIRSTRFPNGLRCPRCGGRKPIRWGHFGARQRYRCRKCRRTFSDLTGTPAAYSKKLLLWPAYVRCMAHGMSVRESAAHVGIHRTTSFRWRHAVLNGVRTQSRVALRGWVEVVWTQMAHSTKGQRRPKSEVHSETRPPDADTAALEAVFGKDALPASQPPARRAPAPRERWVRGYHHRYQGRRVCVVFACDRYGQVLATVCDGRFPRVDHLVKALKPKLRGKPTFLAAHGRAGPIAWLAVRLRARYRSARRHAQPLVGSIAHLDTVHTYRFRFFDWMVRFHGVATKYLPNYLVWHDHVDRSLRRGAARSLLEWPITP